MTAYRVSYINYKGRPSSCFIHAKTEKEAWETASVMQGMYKILKVEVRECIGNLSHRNEGRL